MPQIRQNNPAIQPARASYVEQNPSLEALIRGMNQSMHGSPEKGVQSENPKVKGILRVTRS